MSGGSGIVTLLTDFGSDDPYVGIMKGVVLSEHRGATIIDVCHGVPPQNVALGALWLAQAFAWFPPGSVHVAVVDPGVGSERAALVARASGHLFVAPDNGLLTHVTRAHTDFEARRLELERLGLVPQSRTFHGRDVFARVAGRLAAGRRRFDELGAIHAPVSFDVIPPRDDGERGSGRVLAVDHFGNLITDLPGAWLERGDRSVLIGGRRLRRVATYSEAAEGECVALTSSFGLIEVAARNQSAARLLGAGEGTPVGLVTGGSGGAARVDEVLA